MPRYSEDQLLAELRRVAAIIPAGEALTHGRFAALSAASPHTVIRRFGGWAAGLEAAGLSHCYSGRRVTPKMTTRDSVSLDQDQVVAELRRVAAAAGRSWITKADVHDSPTIGLGVVVARFGSWPAAVAAAGLQLSPHATARTDHELLANLDMVTAELGRFPLTREMTLPPSAIRYPTYRVRYGSWSAAEAAYCQWAAEQTRR